MGDYRAVAADFDRRSRSLPCRSRSPSPLSSSALFPRHSRSLPPSFPRKRESTGRARALLGRPRYSCQNQDLRDYRIFRILPSRFWIRKRLFTFGLAGFAVAAKSAVWAKRNPENPANPDSDKSARSSAWSSVNRNSVIPLKRLIGVSLAFRDSGEG